jgi:hypothetical protein
VFIPRSPLVFPFSACAVCMCVCVCKVLLFFFFQVSFPFALALLLLCFCAYLGSLFFFPFDAMPAVLFTVFLTIFRCPSLTYSFFFVCVFFAVCFFFSKKCVYVSLSMCEFLCPPLQVQ